MNERVARLRQESLDTRPWLSIERARLLTEFYRDSRITSPPLLRAQAFKHLMEHKALYLGESELIVGERGPSPRGTPTYPEICCHSESDLEILNSRLRSSYRVSEAAAETQREEIIPFWKGRTLRERIFAEMAPEWKEAYEAGLFTEFMEQRAPGHTVLGDVIYRKGLIDLKKEVDTSLRNLDFFGDPGALAAARGVSAGDAAGVGGRPWGGRGRPARCRGSASGRRHCRICFTRRSGDEGAAPVDLARRVARDHRAHARPCVPDLHARDHRGGPGRRHRARSE